jgi:hypothetical protein
MLDGEKQAQTLSQDHLETARFEQSKSAVLNSLTSRSSHDCTITRSVNSSSGIVQNLGPLVQALPHI